MHTTIVRRIRDAIQLNECFCCRECDVEVPWLVDVCPHCGAASPVKVSLWSVLIVGTISFLVVLAL
jgi:hypothetical protein